MAAEDDLVPPPSVLVVDDAPENLLILAQCLAELYHVRAAKDGPGALRIAASEPMPDLILLDIVMPDIDGFEVCRRLKSNPATADIPVIFLTGRSLAEDEQRGFALGAVDYISKPISPPVVRARVKTHLQLKASADFLKDRNRFLQQEVDRRTEEVRAIQDVTVHAFASLAETRDNETGNHIRRTQHYVRILATRLQSHPRFKSELDAGATELLFKSAPLHDIGKVGIPDSVLLKPARLSDREFDMMKEHTVIGAATLDAALAHHPEAEFLRMGRDIALTHHERWDGSGYPQGLSGRNIPLCGRIVALADVYDALSSKRVYKDSFDHDVVRSIIVAESGTHFDPDVVQAFLATEQEFIAIRKQFSAVAEGPPAPAPLPAPLAPLSIPTTPVTVS